MDTVIVGVTLVVGVVLTVGWMWLATRTAKCDAELRQQVSDAQCEHLCEMFDLLEEGRKNQK